MTTTQHPVRHWQAGGLAVVVAAAATTLMALVGRSLGVPLEIDGEPIALAAFPVFTVIAGVLGIALALVVNGRVRRPRRVFVTATLVLTALSLVPDLLVQVSTGSRILLMLTHLAAAAIVIPAVSRRLPAA